MKPKSSFAKQNTKRRNPRALLPAACIRAPTLYWSMERSQIFILPAVGERVVSSIFTFNMFYYKLFSLVFNFIFQSQVKVRSITISPAAIIKRNSFKHLYSFFIIYHLFIWRRSELNRQLHACKTCALPIELRPLWKKWDLSP